MQQWMYCIIVNFKGLGHAILGNFRDFSTDQKVIELTINIKITAPNYRRTLTKHRKAKKGHGWTKRERIEMDCISVNLKKRWPPSPLFFKFTLCQFIHVSKCHLHGWKIILRCCGHDFANERLLVCHFDV